MSTIVRKRKSAKPMIEKRLRSDILAYFNEYWHRKLYLNFTFSEITGVLIQKYTIPPLEGVCALVSSLNSNSREVPSFRCIKFSSAKDHFFNRIKDIQDSIKHNISLIKTRCNCLLMKFLRNLA
jgi:hypothetical protein